MNLADLRQALEELAKGERAAAKLESELQAFEAKLDSLLTSLGMTEADLEDDDEVEADPASTDADKPAAKTDTKPEAESKQDEKKDTKE